MEKENNTRVEHDLLGKRELPAHTLYGIQTLRGLENFSISRFKLSYYPAFINGLAWTKMAAADANHQLGLLTDEQYNENTLAVGLGAFAIFCRRTALRGGNDNIARDVQANGNLEH